MTGPAGVLDRLRIPIVQAPMVGASDERMAIAACRAGALGSLAAGALSGPEIRARARAIRDATDAPFAINLFVVRDAVPDPAEVDAAIERLRPWYSRLGLEPPERPNRWGPDFEENFAAVLEIAPAAVSTVFGPLLPEEVAALKARDVAVIGTATNVAEGLAWRDLGADALAAQGAEAGGHRGGWLGDQALGAMGAFALTPLLRQATGLPIVAAGGVMDGRGVAAALTLGASAVQIGTALLRSDQSTISPAWRSALEAALPDATVLTRAFSGRWARGLENAFTREMRAVERDVPAYPVQNRLTQPMRAAAAKAGDPDLISLWAGQGLGEHASNAPEGDAGALIAGWWAEAQRILSG